MLSVTFDGGRPEEREQQEEDEFDADHPQRGQQQAGSNRSWSDVGNSRLGDVHRGRSDELGFECAVGSGAGRRRSGGRGLQHRWSKQWRTGTGGERLDGQESDDGSGQGGVDGGLTRGERRVDTRRGRVGGLTRWKSGAVVGDGEQRRPRTRESMVVPRGFAPVRIDLRARSELLVETAPQDLDGLRQVFGGDQPVTKRAQQLLTASNGATTCRISYEQGVRFDSADEPPGLRQNGEGLSFVERRHLSGTEISPTRATRTPLWPHRLGNSPRWALWHHRRHPRGRRAADAAAPGRCSPSIPLPVHDRSPHDLPERSPRRHSQRKAPPECQPPGGEDTIVAPGGSEKYDGVTLLTYSSSSRVSAGDEALT